MKEGWICPRCKKVNAPFTPFCDCKENDYSNYAAQVDCIHDYHQWECCGVSTAGSTYMCKICGKIKNEYYNVDKSNITITNN